MILLEIYYKMIKSGYFKVLAFTCLFALVCAQKFHRAGGLSDEMSADRDVMILVGMVNMMFINL